MATFEPWWDSSYHSSTCSDWSWIGKHRQGITKHQTHTATRKSPRLQYHQKRACSTNHSAWRHSFPSPSTSNTRNKEVCYHLLILFHRAKILQSSPIGPKAIGTIGKRKWLQKSSCEDTSLQEAQCRQPEPKKRKSEQANPYTSSLEGNFQLNKVYLWICYIMYSALIQDKGPTGVVGLCKQFILRPKA